MKLTIPAVGTKAWYKAIDQALGRPGFKLKLSEACASATPITEEELTQHAKDRKRYLGDKRRFATGNKNYGQGRVSEKQFRQLRDAQLYLQDKVK